jgi:hypothetical protein
LCREQLSELVSTRPPLWEFLLFAGVLWREMQEVEPKWQDYTRGVLQTGPLLTDTEALALASRTLRGGQACISDLLDNFEPAAREAFGASGSPGDPNQIENLGVRLSPDLTSYWILPLPHGELGRATSLHACSTSQEPLAINRFDNCMHGFTE